MDKNRPKINWGEALVPGLGLLFGVGYFLQSLDAPKQALVWPTLTALTVLVFWAPIVVKFVFRKDAPPNRIRLSWLWRDGQRTGLITAATLGYLVLVPFLGFSISNFLFMLAVFRGLGSQQWKKNLTVALVIAVFLHVALVVLMKLSLPQLELGNIAI